MAVIILVLILFAGLVVVNGSDDGKIILFYLHTF